MEDIHQTRSNPSLTDRSHNIFNATSVSAHCLEQTRRSAFQHLSNGQHSSIIPIFPLVARFQWPNRIAKPGMKR